MGKLYPRASGRRRWVRPRVFYASAERMGTFFVNQLSSGFFGEKQLNVFWKSNIFVELPPLTKVEGPLDHIFLFFCENFK